MEHHPPGTKSHARTRTVRSRRVLWIIASIVAGVLAAGGIFYLYTLGKLPFFERAAAPAIHGKVYFAGATAAHSVPNVYLYDFDFGHFELGAGVFTNEAYVRYTTSISPSGTEIAYFNAVAATSSAARPATREVSLASTLQLIRFSRDTPEEFDVRTPDAPYLKLFPEWSPDGQVILYEAYTGEADDSSTELENWTIYRIADEGVEETLVTGSSPKWSPDGTSFVYVRGDGVYQYTVATGSSARVLEFLEPATWGKTRIDISPDGTQLVLTPETKRIERYEVSSWEPFSASLAATANRQHVRHWWPQFSPDGTQVAVIDWEQASDEPTDLRALLAVYGATEQDPFTLLSTVSLDEFDLMAKYISDWR